MEPPISIYAELLPNIRQTSLAVTLRSAADASTSGTVTHSVTSSVVHIQHSGSSASLILPTRVAVPDNYRLPIIPSRLEWRLPVAAGDVRVDGSGSNVPWESKDLVAGGEVCCRKCADVLVREGVVAVWKDLPAEGWAEMMEFWHCHKPDDKHHHHGDGDGDGHGQPKADEKTLASRGYGADSTIAAQSGVGFVDLTTFLFDEDDCEGIMFPTGSVDVLCKHCSAKVGYQNHKTAGVTLFKWAVSVPTGPLYAEHPPPQAEECISAILSATKARTGSSRSLLLPIPGTEPPSPGLSGKDIALYIQILIPAITYASNLSSSSNPVPAMKILYRPVEREERDQMLEDLNSDVQEVNLAWEEIINLVSMSGSLAASTLLLPQAQREFRGCKVGMLRRWEG